MGPDNQFIKFELVDDIIVATYKEVFVNIEVAKSVLEDRHKYTVDRSRPMLVDTSLLKGVDKEARDFFSLPSGSEGLTATALLVKSRFNSFFVNFLIKVNLFKSTLPIKVFNNFDEAVAWLERYK